METREVGWPLPGPRPALELDTLEHTSSELLGDLNQSIDEEQQGGRRC